MSAPGVSELRRAASAAQGGVLRGPTSVFAANAAANDWNHELPGTGVEIVLEFDGGWELEIDGHRSHVSAFAAGLVAGPARSRAQGSVRLVQIAVDPLAIPGLFGVPAGELAGAAVPVDALLGADAGRLLDHLDGRQQRGAAAEQWACSCVAAAKADRGPLVPPDVERAVALIRASGGTVRIETVAEELGCSRRHLARRFAEWVGVSPSEYRQLVRFEQATSSLRADSSLPLGRLALECGYADHAHMDRDFRRLAGAPPSTVAEQFA